MPSLNEQRQLTTTDRQRQGESRTTADSVNLSKPSVPPWALASSMQKPELGRANVSSAALDTNRLSSVDQQPNVTLEEYFSGYIEEILDDALILRTTSSHGEEATASLSMEQVPPSERRHIQVGAPIRISVVLHEAPSRKRVTRVWLPRLSSLNATAEGMQHTVDVFYARVQSILARTSERHG